MWPFAVEHAADRAQTAHVRIARPLDALCGCQRPHAQEGAATLNHTSQAQGGLSSLPVQELTVDALPSKACRPLRMESAEDRHCPAAATGIEHAITRIVSI
jgi:hypothetical protein